jgi:enolase
MMLPVGAPRSPKRCAGHRVFHSQVGAEGPRPEHGVGDEGGFAPTSAATSKRSTPSSKRSARPATPPVKTLLGLDVASSEFFENGKYNLVGENKRLTSEQPTSSPTGRAVPDHHDRRRHGRERLGRLEAADRPHRQEGAAGGRRPVRDQPKIFQEGIDSAPPTRS